MQSKFLTTRSIRLHYLDNEADAPVLLLLHGLSANAHAFDGLMNAGLGGSFRVVSVDLRGRGLSDHPQNGYGMREHASDILDLMDRLNLSTACVAGHSFGGFLGLYLAAFSPERIERLVMIDAAARVHPNAKEMLGPTLDRLGKTFCSFEHYLQQVKEAPFLSMWDEAMRTYYRADVQDNADGSVTPRSSLAHIMEAALKGSLGEPWAELIRAVHTPCLLINATGVYTFDAPLLPKELALETVGFMENCSYVEVPGNHHTMLYGEGARKIVDAIRNFLS